MSPMLPPLERSIRSMVNLSRQTSHASSTPWMTALRGSPEFCTRAFVRSTTEASGCAEGVFRHVGLAKLEPVAEHGHVLQARADLLDVALGLVTEALEQQARVVLWRDELRSLRMDLAVAHADFIDLIHQLRDEEKPEAGRAEGRDLMFRRENHLGVLGRVLKIVFAQHPGDKVARTP